MSNEAPEIGIVFETEAEFRREFATNLANGGVFVPTERAFGIRENIHLGIDLAYCGRSLVLEGEVVHQVPAELAAVGAHPGVALQLLMPASELRAQLEALDGAFSPDFDESTLVVEQDDPSHERRKAPRGKARVPAYLIAPDGEVHEGFTRNLSESGLLFAMTSDPLPIDSAVVLRLTNPVSGESREISGSVARHVVGDDGFVTAIGIHFGSEAERPVGVTLFLRNLKATEHSRHLGGITGSIAEVGLMSLVQNFSQSAPQGTLTIASGAEEGFVAFDGGQMVAARLGTVTGTKALARLLAWQDGRFEFHARVDPSVAVDEPITMQGAMMEAVRQIDELARLDLRLLPPSAALRIASGAPDVMGGGLEKLEEAVVDLCVGKTTVRRILDVIPEPDADIYKAMLFLLESQAISLQPTRA